MDFAVLLCLFEKPAKKDTSRPVQLFYEAFLQAISDQILLYRLKQAATESSAVCSLVAVQRRTRRAIRQYETAAISAKGHAECRECRTEQRQRAGTNDIDVRPISTILANFDCRPVASYRQWWTLSTGSAHLQTTSMRMI